jgi:outer membrane biosynthesis protein TonB
MAAKTGKWLVALCALTAIVGVHTVGGAEPDPSAGPLPQTCEEPVRKNSALTIRIHLTAEAFARVQFEHSKPEAALPAGVLGQSQVCACVDSGGNLRDSIKLIRGSGSGVLDTEALEIGKTLDYPAGHPGCMHDTINFAGP